MSGARILVIDDDPSVRTAVRSALQAAGHELSEASFGAGAVERVRAFKPDLVLLDLVLPDATGQEILERLRAIPEGASIPIVGFTGYYGTVEDAQESAPGFTGYLIKPLKGAALLRQVTEFLRKDKDGANPPEP